ncbi:MAG: flagellar biosynthesis protein FlgM [Alphaproteobacteria bacterium]|nr:flagellar biosynthesis protein FlgM [Alphaproteobacteria bacterium]
MVKWRGREKSDNIEDRRGAAGAAGMGALAFLLIRFVLSRFGIVGVVVLVGGYFALRQVGIDPLALLNGQTAMVSGGQSRELSAEEEQAGDFVSVMLRETERTWGQRFAAAGSDYVEPGLVLFSQGTQSGCGPASSAMGPFYCPADRKIYLDTAFFDELARRFGAVGDFAAAYVVAHEVGHHVQTITGISDDVRQRQAAVGEVQRNALQVRMELQADCYAGIWAHDADRTAGILEPGDIEEGLRAASAIGDDALQRQAGAEVRQETFTHGASDQRVRWFTIGYREGSVAACDTFRTDKL